MLKRMAKAYVRRAFSAIGIEVRRASHDWSDTAQFIPLKETLEGAKRAGLSVGDYIDGVMNHIPGTTQATIDVMRSFGVFENSIDRAIEIGPGSGRYLEKTIAICAPKRFEIYETAKPWAEYLAATYPTVTVQPTDGFTLGASASESADLVQAHKVFSGINLIPTLGYFREMSRVARQGGFVVFDVLTERCLGDKTIDRWIESGFHTGAYPACVPRSTCIDYFGCKGFYLAGSELIPIGPGTTELFIFQRKA